MSLSLRGDVYELRRVLQTGSWQETLNRELSSREERVTLVCDHVSRDVKSSYDCEPLRLVGLESRGCRAGSESQHPAFFFYILTINKC